MAILSLEPNWSAPNGSELSRRRHGGPIVVGLVNNMPDPALKNAERQFRELLADAAGRRAVRVRVFSLPGLSRSEAARQHVREHHEDIEDLWTADLDGLIVTGTEPRAPDLADEPYWPELTRLIDWAADHTISTAWSCLAAHAAVRYLDGVVRRPLAAKLSGVFDCVRVADHPLVGGNPARWCTPHSRRNELADEALVSHGYQILSRASGAGADIFVKQEKSLFLFLQGHPEYDAGALLREYRRDIGRFLAGERDRYPDMPSGYFDAATAESMVELREQAMRERDPALLPSFQMLLAARNLSDPWRAAAIRLFANWLEYLAEQKSFRRGWTNPHRAPRVAARAGLVDG
jgi:homoserine O-succinyltransferase